MVKLDRWTITHYKYVLLGYALLGLGRQPVGAVASGAGHPAVPSEGVEG